MPDDQPARFDALHSVRFRVALAVAAVAAGVLVAVAVLLIRLQESAAIAHLDEILSDEAEAIGLALSEAREVPTLLDDDRVLLARGPDGTIIVFLGTTALALAGVVIDAPDDRGITTVIGGQAHRVVDSRFVTDDGIGHVLLAEPLDELDHSVTELRHTLLWVIPLTVIGLAAITWWLVGLALRSLDKMRRDVATIGIRELDHRVTVPPGGDEVTQLAITLNNMLKDLETSIRGRQRFIADASHELRTPLARMRAEVEADMLQLDGADVERAQASRYDEIVALQNLVDEMLLLTRADLGGPEAPHVPVDLDDLVLDEVQSYRPTATATLDLSAVSAAQVQGSADELRRVVRNLIDNALRHATSQVAITLYEDNGTATLIVDDDGPGIPDERREEVFERFRRLDAERAGQPGAGLGLAIVAELTARHEGTVTIDDSPLGGARFTVQLPV